MSRYRSINSYLREQFGEKVYKLSLDGGFTCPTRDGTKGTRGCIFCSGGSGDFSIPVENDVYQAIETAKSLVAGKGLRYLYFETIRHPDIVALSIATRPDCISDEVLSLLSELNRIKPVWVELGLQTFHPQTAEYIRRGYPLSDYDKAVQDLSEIGINVIVHMIIGLPGETPEMMVDTARYIGQSGADGIKFQLLHVLKNTDLADDYLSGLFHTLSLDNYISVLEQCIEQIPPSMLIHRLTGDGAKRDLLAPFGVLTRNMFSTQFNVHL